MKITAPDLADSQRAKIMKRDKLENADTTRAKIVIRDNFAYADLRGVKRDEP